ncbi:hypothetical protein [Marinobacter salarius]|uniref:hypothetical protein n=1 Tax=Marinobacter salarius TaxID=1420917 RepID=UPI003BAD7A70
MEPITITIIGAFTGAVLTAAVGYLAYQNKRKDKRIDDISESLRYEVNNVRILQTQIITIDNSQKLLRSEVARIPILNEKINSLENVYNVLNEINKNISEMSADIRVIKSNYSHVYKELERLDKDINSVKDDVKSATGNHRRKDDPK